MIGCLVIEKTIKVAKGQVRKDFIYHIVGLGLGPISNEKTVKSFSHENTIVIKQNKSLWWL